MFAISNRPRVVTLLLLVLAVSSCDSDPDPGDTDAGDVAYARPCAIIYAADYSGTVWASDGIWAVQSAQRAAAGLVARGWDAEVVSVKGHDALAADLDARAARGQRCAIVATVSHAGYHGPLLANVDRCIEQAGGLGWDGPGVHIPATIVTEPDFQKLGQLTDRFAAVLSGDGCAVFMGCNTGANGDAMSQSSFGHETYAHAVSARSNICAVGAKGSVSLGNFKAVTDALASGRVPRGFIRVRPAAQRLIGPPESTRDSVVSFADDGGDCAPDAPECAGTASCVPEPNGSACIGSGPPPPSTPPPSDHSCQDEANLDYQSCLLWASNERSDCLDQCSVYDFSCGECYVAYGQDAQACRDEYEWALRECRAQR